MQSQRTTKLVIDSSGIPVLNMTTTLPLTMKQVHMLFPAIRKQAEQNVIAAHYDHPACNHKFSDIFEPSNDYATWKYVIGVDSIRCNIPFAKFLEEGTETYGWSTSGVSKPVEFNISMRDNFFSFIVIDSSGHPWCYTIHFGRTTGYDPSISTWQFPNIDTAGRACLGNCGFSHEKALETPEKAIIELSKWLDAKWNHDWHYDRSFAAARMLPFILDGPKLLQTKPKFNYENHVACLSSFNFPKLLLNEITVRLGLNEVYVKGSDQMDHVWNRIASIDSYVELEKLREFIDENLLDESQQDNGPITVIDPDLHHHPTNEAVEIPIDPNDLTLDLNEALGTEGNTMEGDPA